MIKQILIILILSLSLTGICSEEKTITNYKIIGDSVFLDNGITCHIDNFVNGTCETEDWWGFNFFNFWIGLLIPFVFFGYIIFTIKRKMGKRK